MGQETISQLFKPFYANDTGVGAGSGFAAVYGFVKQCGGGIDVRSQPHNETTFRLFLPSQILGLEVGNP